MLKNYILSVWRQATRNKAFTIINISGLAIGMLACMLIAQFVLHEVTYDNFLEKKDRIFRVQLDRFEKGIIATQWAAGCAGIGPDLKANFPEVERMVRMHGGGATFAIGDLFYKEDNVYFASEDFFKMFSIKLTEGIDSLVLKDPFRIVVSQSMARKYFGKENPLGKILRANGRREYEVSGVFEDLPVKSHMKIDALYSFVTYEKIVGNPIQTWDWDGFFTYVLLKEKTHANELEAKLPAFVQKHENKTSNDPVTVVFHLQPVSTIHLDSDYMEEFKANGNRQSVYFLSVVAVLIMIIA